MLTDRNWRSESGQYYPCLRAQGIPTSGYQRVSLGWGFDPAPSVRSRNKFIIVTLKGSRFSEDEDPFRMTIHLGYSWTDPSVSLSQKIGSKINWIKKGVVPLNHTYLLLLPNSHAAARCGAGVRLRFVSRMSYEGSFVRNSVCVLRGSRGMVSCTRLPASSITGTGKFAYTTLLSAP
jgi:hypothetical protein